MDYFVDFINIFIEIISMKFDITDYLMFDVPKIMNSNRALIENGTCIVCMVVN